MRVALPLVLTLAPAVLGAQTPTFSVSVTEPDEVIGAIGTTRRISRADIEAHDAATLDEALRLVPGVYVRTGGDGTPRIDVRGFRSRHVLLLIDGVPYNSTVDGQFDPARISTESIREITVSYGSSSVLYGDNAMAAVVEIVTGSPQPGMRADVTASTPGAREAGGQLTRSYGALDVAIAGNTFATVGYRLPGSFTPTANEDGGRRENSDRARHELRANLAYTVSPTLRLGTEWTVGRGSYGVPPSTISNPNDIFAQAVRYDRVNGYRSASGQGSLAYAPVPRVRLRAWAYRNAQREDVARYDDATYSSIDNPLVSGTYQSRDRTTVSGGSVLGRLDLHRAGWLRVALNDRRESFTSAGQIRDVVLSGSGGGTGGGGGGGGGRGQTTTATYGLRAYDLSRHVDVASAGAEWQFHVVPRLGAALGAAINRQDRPDAGARTAPTWIAGLTYDVTPALRVHASATHKIRFPSIDQFYNVSAGNTGLRPERANGVDAGVDRSFGASTRVGVSGYSTRAVNFIERDPGARFTNRDRFRFSGVETVVETAAIARLDLRAVYSFLDAVDLNPGAGGAELQYRPRHRASLEAGWHASSRLTARATLQGVADQRYYSRGAVPVQARAGDYVLVDAGAAFALSKQLEIAGGVDNVLDRLYEQSYGLPREGRTAFLVLRARVP